MMLYKFNAEKIITNKLSITELVILGRQKPYNFF